MSDVRTVTNATIEMIRQIRSRLYERIQQGKLNYQADIKTLRLHLSIAEQLNEQLVGELQSMIGLVEAEKGNLAAAEQALFAAIETFQKLEDIKHMGRSYRDLGTVYLRAGKYELAIEAYQEARTRSEKAGDFREVIAAENALADVWMAQFDIQNAKLCYALILAVTEDQPWLYVHHIIDAHRGFAEIYLAQENYEAAWKEVSRAENLASEPRYRIHLARLHLTQAHIAAKDPNSPQNKEHYYAASRSVLIEGSNLRMLARFLYDEARYQNHHDNPERARAAGMEAMVFYEALDLDEEAQIVREFLKDILSRGIE